MFPCERCTKAFNTNWQLQRHYSRRTPCNPSTPAITPNATPIGENIENTTNVQNLKCIYCLKQLSRIDHLNTHMGICNEKNDAVRILEMKLGIDYKPHIHHKGCRFCNAIFTQTCSLTRHLKTCNAKEEYKRMLQEKLKEKDGKEHQLPQQPTTQINNINITNNNNNTININCPIVLRAFGNENPECLSKDEFEKICNRFIKFKGDFEGFLKAIVVKIFANPNHPENHNVLMQGVNKPHALVYDGDDFVNQSAVSVTQKMMENGGMMMLDLYDEHEGELKHTIGEHKMKHIDNTFVANDPNRRESGRFRNAIKGVMCDSQHKQIIKTTRKRVRRTISS